MYSTGQTTQVFAESPKLKLIGRDGKKGTPFLSFLFPNTICQYIRVSVCTGNAVPDIGATSPSLLIGNHFGFLADSTKILALHY